MVARSDAWRSNMMRRLLSLVSLVTGLCGAPAIQAADQDVPPGFQALFNGKDLSGWKVYNGKDSAWGAADGLLFTTGERGGGWLMTENEYGDFELILEYKVPKGGNSGVAVHSPL